MFWFWQFCVIQDMAMFIHVSHWQVWHWILSSFSSGLSGALFGAAEDPPPVPAPAPTPEPEEAAKHIFVGR